MCVQYHSGRWHRNQSISPVYISTTINDIIYKHAHTYMYSIQLHHLCAIKSSICWELTSSLKVTNPKPRSDIITVDSTSPYLQIEWPGACASYRRRQIICACVHVCVRESMHAGACICMCVSWSALTKRTHVLKWSSNSACLKFGANPPTKILRPCAYDVLSIASATGNNKSKQTRVPSNLRILVDIHSRQQI